MTGGRSLVPEDWADLIIARLLWDYGDELDMPYQPIKATSIRFKKVHKDSGIRGEVRPLLLGRDLFCPRDHRDG